MKKKSLAGKLLLTLVLAVVGVLFLLPLLWMISSSLKTGITVFSSDFKWVPDNPQWKNYVTVLTSKTKPILTMYYNSLKIALLTIVGQLLVSSLAAYAFAKINFKGKNIVFILLLGSMMIPSQATIIPRFVMFQNLGLFNTHTALILPAWFSVSAVFLLRQFYQKVPHDLVEAALIDGAGHLLIWRRIILPLTKMAMISLVILGFIATWNDFLTPLVFLTDKSLFTVSLGVNLYNSTDGDSVHLIMTASTIAIVPVIVLFAVCQKYFVEGITTSGLKG